MQRRARQAISLISTIILGLILFIAISHPIDRQVSIQWLSPFGLGLAAVALSYCLWSITKCSPQMTQRTILKLTCILAIIMLFVQLWLSVNIIGLGSLDPAAIRLQAASLATGHHHWFTYFSWYPNNVNITLILSSIMKITHLTHGVEFGIFLNIWLFLHIDLAIYLVWRLIRSHWGLTTALTFLLIGSLFLPFYLYGLNFYTDGLVLPYPLLFYASLNQAWQHSSRRPMWIALAVVAFVFGFLIKGNTIVFGIAGVLAWLGTKQPTAKRLFNVLIVSFIALLLMFGGAKITQQIAHQTGYRQQTTLTFPTLSWTLMGLNPQSKGTFSGSDIAQTTQHATATENQQAVKKALLERIQNLGGVGLFKQLISKTITMWSSGIQGGLMWPDDFLRIPETYFTNQRTIQTMLANFAQIVYLVILGFALLSSLQSIRRADWLILLLELSLLGIFFLHILFWEVESRYAFLTSPFLLGLAARGLSTRVEPSFSLETQSIGRHPLILCLTSVLLIGYGTFTWQNRSWMTPTTTNSIVTQQPISGYFQQQTLTLQSHQTLQQPLTFAQPINQLTVGDVAKLKSAITLSIVQDSKRSVIESGRPFDTMPAGKARLLIRNTSNHTIQIPVVESAVIPLDSTSIHNHPHTYLKYIVYQTKSTALLPSRLALLLLIMQCLLILISSWLLW